MVISGNQWQSVAISGNQWQSVHPDRLTRGRAIGSEEIGAAQMPKVAVDLPRGDSSTRPLLRGKLACMTGSWLACRPLLRGKLACMVWHSRFFQLWYSYRKDNKEEFKSILVVY